MCVCVCVTCKHTHTQTQTQTLSPWSVCTLCGCVEVWVVLRWCVCVCVCVCVISCMLPLACFSSRFLSMPCPLFESHFFSSLCSWSPKRRLWRTASLSLDGPHRVRWEGKEGRIRWERERERESESEREREREKTKLYKKQKARPGCGCRGFFSSFWVCLTPYVKFYSIYLTVLSSPGAIQFSGYGTRYRPGLDLVLRGIDCSIRGGEKVRWIFILARHHIKSSSS